MTYPQVKNAHIVPRCYLRNFAAGEKIAVRIVGDAAKPKITSISKTGTRKTYYRRTRPDGTPIDDIEWSLSQGEKAAGYVLRELRERWPLTFDEKGRLASLIGIQLVRGPRWMAWRAEQTAKILEEHRRAGTDVDGFGDYIVADTQRLLQMLELGRKMMAVFGSMHWTLVEFPSPMLVSSDHPVVQWPAGAGARQPAPTPLNVGVMENLEVRVPVTPQLAILMTWSDAPDDEGSVASASRHHAATLNAFTIAEADRQWYHHPTSATPTTTGRLLPLSPQLIPGYGVGAAVRSRRRERVVGVVKDLIGAELTDNEIDMIWISRKGIVERAKHAVIAEDGEPSLPM